MKKIIAILLTLILVFSFTACNSSSDDSQGTTEKDTQTEAPSTVGTILLDDFKKDNAGTAQEIADRLLQNEVIQFMGGAMPVEEGLLTGFDNAEIKGFKEGVVFMPMIGTIPFIGYIFELEDGADVSAFKDTLKDNANLRWNICTEAEELIVESEGNKVFFVMCPKSFEEAESSVSDVGGIELPDDTF